jgi:phosphoserine aminotransferase
VIFAVVLMLAAGTSLSTSAAALATPLGPWLPNPPIDLSATGRNAYDPQVATGPDGATTIIWRRDNGSSYIVQAATRAANATTFSTPIDVSTIGANALSPQLAIGPDGTTTITWTRPNSSSNYIVQAATRAANATTFSTPIDLSTIGANAESPQLAIGPDGTTTITWYRSNGLNTIVQAATRAAGATTFSTPIDLSTTGQSAESPQVATGPDGTTTITWTRSNGSAYIVQAATRAAGATTFSTPIDLSTIGGNALSPQVATGPDGTTTISWRRYSGSNFIVQAATRAAGATTFSTPINLSGTGGNAENPQVATGPDGTTTITWTRPNSSSNYIVQAATRAAGATTFSTPIDLSTTGQSAGSPQVATGPDGTTTITWTRENGNGPVSGPMRSPEGIVQAVTATPPPSVLTVTKAGNGTVTSTPANINCGTTCTATITNLTTITLTATPAADSTFSGWSGDCTGISTCTVSMTDARNVTATFTLTPITPITLSATSPLPTTPTAIRWTPRTGAINKPITGSFTATTNTTYTITATSNTARSFENRATRTARGTCKITTNKKTKQRTAKCAIRFKHAGTWLVKITPTQNGIAGTPATKTIKIRAAAKKTRTLPIHQRQALAQR